MFQAFPTHHQNTSQRQGAILKTLISTDAKTYYPRTVKQIDTLREPQIMTLCENPKDTHFSDVPLIKGTSKKPHEIARLLQTHIRGYFSTAHPEIEQKVIKLDSYAQESQHILKLQMPATHLDAWLGIMQLLEPFQRDLYTQNGLFMPFAFNLDSSDFQFEEGGSSLWYNLANIKEQLASFFRIPMDLSPSRMNMMREFQQPILDSLKFEMRLLER
jgi:hypothetical protein